MLSQDLSLTELACTPQVSPTATYQEIIQGKNMSLVIISTRVSNKGSRRFNKHNHRPSLMTFESVSQFHFYLLWINVYLA